MSLETVRGAARRRIEADEDSAEERRQAAATYREALGAHHAIHGYLADIAAAHPSTLHAPHNVREDERQVSVPVPLPAAEGDPQLHARVVHATGSEGNPYFSPSILIEFFIDADSSAALQHVVDLGKSANGIPVRGAQLTQETIRISTQTSPMIIRREGGGWEIDINRRGFELGQSDERIDTMASPELERRTVSLELERDRFLPFVELIGEALGYEPLFDAPLENH